ncbi:uncharacterized protein PITG_10537 [Phytophthora infestans T30-4]|uniref:Tyr recombinase domain-containing protein n=1 Tax=Phytophthora infestans (strain T30-4) TaxID=403677 RepID=D0NFJ7_PHYIT|nr:uncharacterized protein PITG_10537 [Phytophthora infestans T30-4]EEY56986.1 conserved hypothetical protein [Phytophthora infestans T30-4]|eukprot:XP_002902314.1 conserved hypothetical protein [Phytophthora infestans T30-4]
MTPQATSFQDLLQGGITTTTHVIKKETRDVYASYFKKLCDFCISNEYSDPATIRHHELPSLLSSRLWFFNMTLTAYGMCRINEVLSLRWKNLPQSLTRPSTADPSVPYGVHKLEGRKTDWNGNDYIFPALSKILKSVIKTDDTSTGCENARVEWGKKMSGQAFITLLNSAVRDLNRNGYRFMFAPPEGLWSLRMVKWWAGWTQNESAETLVRYLLDQAATDEDTQLADCVAPDRDAHVGCPTAFS